MKNQNLQFDSEQLQTATHTAIQMFGWSHNNQIGLSHRPGSSEVYSSERVHGECIRAGFKDGKKVLEDREISEFNSEFRNTYFFDVWEGMFTWSQMTYGYGICRMRLMMLPPMSTISFHRDFEDRFHVAILTNPYAFILEGGQDYNIDDDGRLEPQLESYHIPDDGYVYKLDGYKRHCAMNGHGNMERIHLVASLARPVDESRR